MGTTNMDTTPTESQIAPVNILPNDEFTAVINTISSEAPSKFFPSTNPFGPSTNIEIK